MPDKVRNFIYELQYNFVFLQSVLKAAAMEDINTRNIGSLTSLLEAAQHLVIVTHAKPDGDAVGSCVAMYHFLHMIGKKDVRTVLNDRYPKYLDFIADTVSETDLVINEDDPEEARNAIMTSDLIFCLDFNAFHRTRNLEEYLAGSPADKVLIDHHLDPDRDSFAVSFSKTEVSSASELVYQVLMSTPYISHDASKLPSASLLAIMTGMTTDTNNLNNSVFPSTLEMASELLRCKVDRDLVLRKINLEHSESRLRLKGYMLKDLMQITEDGVAYMILNKEDQQRFQMKEGDTEGFVNEPLSIAKVRMSIYAREEKNEIRISIRSKKGTSANRCANLFFNGGGHENAAGGKLLIPVTEVEGYIRRFTHIYMTEHEK